MMSLWLIRTWLRRGLTNKYVFVATLLSIAFAVGLSIALMSLSIELSESILSQVKAINGGDLAVSWQTTDDWDQLAMRVGQVNSVVPDAQVDAAYIGKTSVRGHPDQASLAVIRGVTNHFPLYGQVRLARSGRLPFAALFKHHNGAFVSETLGDRLGIKVGDILSVGGGHAKRLKVLGIVVDDGLKDQDMHLWGYVFVAREKVPELLSPARTESRIYMRTTGYRQVKTAAATLARTFDDGEVTTWERARQNTKGAIESLNAFFFVIAFLAVAVSSLGVATTVRFQVSRDIRALCTLKSFGLKSSTAWALYICQIGATALVGGLMGIALGQVISFFAASALGSAFSTDIVWHFRVLPAILGLSIGLITALAAGVLPVSAGLKVQPAVVFRQWESMSLKAPRKTTLLFVTLSSIAFSTALWWMLGSFMGFVAGLVLLTFTFLIALFAMGLVRLVGNLIPRRYPMANLAAGTLRAFSLRSTAAITAVATAALIAIVGWGAASSIKSQVLDSLQDDLGFNVAIETAVSDNADVLTFLDRTLSVRHAEAQLFTQGQLEAVNTRGRIRRLDRRNPPGLQGIIDKSKIVPSLKAGRALPRQRPAEKYVPALVSEKIAEEQRIKLRDKLRLRSLGKKIDLRVVGIYRHTSINLGSPVIVRAEHLPAKIWVSSLVLARVAPPSEAAALATRVNREMPRAFAYSTDQLVPSIDALIQRNWLPMLGLVSLSFIGGLIICASSVLFSLVQHVIDFGVIRALGGRFNALLKLVGWEFLIIGSGGAFCGSLLGVGLLMLIGRMTLGTAIKVDWSLVFTTVLIILSVVVGLALGTTRLWLRARPVEMMRGD